MITDRVFLIGLEVFLCNFVETSHYIALQAQGPFCLKGFLCFLVPEKRGKVVLEFVIEGSALLLRGEKQENLNFRIVHLPAYNFIERKLLMRLAFDLLELLLRKRHPVDRVAIEFYLLADEAISLEVHG